MNQLLCQLILIQQLGPLGPYSSRRLLLFLSLDAELKPLVSGPRTSANFLQLAGHQLGRPKTDEFRSNRLCLRRELISGHV